MTQRGFVIASAVLASVASVARAAPIPSSEVSWSPSDPPAKVLPGATSGAARALLSGTTGGGSWRPGGFGDGNGYAPGSSTGSTVGSSVHTSAPARIEPSGGTELVTRNGVTYTRYASDLISASEYTPVPAADRLRADEDSLFADVMVFISLLLIIGAPLMGLGMLCLPLLARRRTVTDQTI